MNNNINLETKLEWAKLDDVKVGDVLVTDSGFTCMGNGEHKIVGEDEDGELFIRCAEGCHMLEGQLNDDGYLVGLTPETKS